MKTLSEVRKNTYYDSVSLMGLSKRLLDAPGITAISVSMGTDMNKQILVDGGFDSSSLAGASPNDLMIACSYDDACDPEDVMALIEEALTVQNGPGADHVERPRTLSAAAEQIEATIAVVSVPGAYAAAEARKALDRNLHVLMFSDNVSLEDEVELKELAHSKGLLMMGPDCGTCIFQGKAFCFANKVGRGGVGIVSASGTGSQEVSVLLHEAGIGISQLIGTGGRDLSREVGGIMFLDAFDALEADPCTSHILLVSKPPHETVAQRVRERIARCEKPVVACFLGAKPGRRADGAVWADGLEEAVDAMVRLVCPERAPREDRLPSPGKTASGRHLRGLFCGGTLMEEAKLAFMRELPTADVRSNSPKGGALPLEDPSKSVANTFLDLGDDRFTCGKPHPMIDPDIRNARIVAEAADPETAVILLDFVLGYGAHEDPVQAALPAIDEAQHIAAADKRSIVFVAYVLGTDDDPQDKRRQRDLLERQGVLVCESNAQAAKLSASLVKELQR